MMSVKDPSSTNVKSTFLIQNHFLYLLSVQTTVPPRPLPTRRSGRYIFRLSFNCDASFCFSFFFVILLWESYLIFQALQDDTMEELEVTFDLHVYKPGLI